jgi:hypothetical protein
MRTDEDRLHVVETVASIWEKSPQELAITQNLLFMAGLVDVVALSQWGRSTVPLATTPPPSLPHGCCWHV